MEIMPGDEDSIYVSEIENYNIAAGTLLRNLTVSGAAASFTEVKPPRK
jgi:hypothetical protein